MPHPLTPGGYHPVRTYQYLNRYAKKLPQNWWTVVVVIIIIILLDHWFIWLFLVGGCFIAACRVLYLFGHVAIHRTTKP